MLHRKLESMKTLQEQIAREKVAFLTDEELEEAADGQYAGVARMVAAYAALREMYQEAVDVAWDVYGIVMKESNQTIMDRITPPHPTTDPQPAPPAPAETR